MLIVQTLNFKNAFFLFVVLSSHCRVGGLVDSLTLRGGGKSVELCCCGGGQLVELKKVLF